MGPFVSLLRRNRNYRNLWLGQVVSEVGDHFNSIAVLSLTLHVTGSGLAVGTVMIARTLPMVLASPWAGVALDRRDRRLIMIASDLARALLAFAFLLIPAYRQTWLIYVLSGALMFASPFFTAGRSAILPTIAHGEELHTANAMTQTTSWLTLSIGTMLGGVSTMQFGYDWAFVANALSFVFSAWAIGQLRAPEGFRVAQAAGAGGSFWGEYRQSLRYIVHTPLVLAIGLAGVGWATGGGAAQVLFTLYGELVFQRGPAGIGIIWSSAGLGLVAGGMLGHRLGPKLNFQGYKRAIGFFFLLHGGAYILFSQMPTIWLAAAWIFVSRVAMGANSVLNRTMLLTHVPNTLRGRVFSTVDMMSNVTMMLSLAAAGAATGQYPVRTIGLVAGILSASTAGFWMWADLAGKLDEVPNEPAAMEGKRQ